MPMCDDRIVRDTPDSLTQASISTSVSRRRASAPQPIGLWLTGAARDTGVVREKQPRARRAGTPPPAPVDPADPRAAAELAEAITLAEAARLLGISTRTIHRLIAAGHLQPFYLPHSGRPRLPLDQINRIRRQTDRRAVRAELSALERATQARRERPSDEGGADTGPRPSRSRG